MHPKFQVFVADHNKRYIYSYVLGRPAARRVIGRPSYGREEDIDRCFDLIG